MATVSQCLSMAALRTLAMAHFLLSSYSAEACDLSGKNIRYLIRVCKDTGECQRARSSIDIVGDKVVDYSDVPGNGTIYSLNNSKTVTEKDDPDTNDTVLQNRLQSAHVRLSSSFNSSVLKLNKEVSFVRTGTKVAMATRNSINIAIENCASCRVLAFELYVESFENGNFVNQRLVQPLSCEVTGLR